MAHHLWIGRKEHINNNSILNGVKSAFILTFCQNRKFKMGKDILARVNNCEAKYCKTMKVGLFKEALNDTQNNFVYERERERSKHESEGKK